MIKQCINSQCEAVGLGLLCGGLSASHCIIDRYGHDGGDFQHTVFNCTAWLLKNGLR